MTPPRAPRCKHYIEDRPDHVIRCYRYPGHPDPHVHLWRHHVEWVDDGRVYYSDDPSIPVGSYPWGRVRPRHLRPVDP